MRRLSGPACCRLREGDYPPEALYELFRDCREHKLNLREGSSEPETANGGLVLPSAGTDAERHPVARRTS
jgi:hypothetical protein